MKNLDISSLNFDDIKASFKAFLSGNPDYKDFNFEASGISTMLNVASYQTHYIGFFVKMLLDEAFSDSAHTRQALLSHAKKSSYIPKGKQSAQAEVVLKINTTLSAEPLSLSISIDRGTTFKAVNNNQDQRIFSVLDGTTLNNRIVTGSNVQYVSTPFKIYEGVFRDWNFIVDSSVINQRFVIKDPNVDVSTFRVRVKENSGATLFTEYKLVDDVLDLAANSTAFFVSTDENGFYQIFFGNNVFGVQPSNGNAIQVSYISTNGETGNGAKTFVFQPGLLPYTSSVTDTTSVSAGGLEPQTIEELRFAIPNHRKRQNRVVTTSDFRSVLLDEFRNVDSMNVWGGEDNIVRDYGKIYVSVKPKNADRLTSLSRKQIRDTIIKKYGVVGIDVVFVDPDFINVDLTITAKLDLRKTTRSSPELVNLILDNVQTYNTTNLSKFDSILSDIDMLSFVKAGDPSFVSLYSTKILKKYYTHLHNSTSTNTVTFGNPLTPGTITSGHITYGINTGPVYLKDTGTGKLSLLKVADDSVVVANTGTIDYASGNISYSLPVAARITGFETSTTGILLFSATPSVPDINTSMNNIVRIESVKVITG